MRIGVAVIERDTLNWIRPRSRSTRWRWSYGVMPSYSSCLRRMFDFQGKWAAKARGLLRWCRGMAWSPASSGESPFAPRWHYPR